MSFVTGPKFKCSDFFVFQCLAHLFLRCVVQKNLENRNMRLRKQLKGKGGGDLEIEKKIAANDAGKFNDSCLLSLFIDANSELKSLSSRQSLHVNASNCRGDVFENTTDLDHQGKNLLAKTILNCILRTVQILLTNWARQLLRAHVVNRILTETIVIWRPRRIQTSWKSLRGYLGPFLLLIEMVRTPIF